MKSFVRKDQSAQNDTYVPLGPVREREIARDGRGGEFVAISSA